MKPFDLKAALAGAPVVTRDGKAVKWIAHDPGAIESSRVIARIGNATGHEKFYESGQTWNWTETQSDLFMAPVKREGWVNIYKTPSGVPYAKCGDIHATEDLAEAENFEAVATTRIEWEE